MSYTTAHTSNFPTSTTAATPMIPTASPHVPLAMDRRQVVPIESAGTNTTTTAAAPPRPAAAYTANLEAQVRVLEQEVQLLRSGLAQNEKLRQVAGLGTTASQTETQKRVRFGPASVVHISPTRQPARAKVTQPGTTRPTSQSGSSTGSGAGGADGRPRLAFGQRVDVTKPRHSSSASLPASTPNIGNAPPSTAAVACPSNTAAAVELTPAPASLRGSNTNGIPLQGAGVGGTAVAPIEGAAAASPVPAAGATVWASADPTHRLWSRTTTTAAPTAGAATADLARYPFRTTPAATTNVPGAAPPAAQEAGAPSPAAPPQPVVVVAMSSDGPPLAPPAMATALTDAPTTVLAVPTSAASPSPATVPDGTAATVTLPGVTTEPAHLPPSTAAPPEPPPPQQQHRHQLETEVLVLRDTLAQREALLHRLLRELHDRGGNGAVTVGNAATLPKTSPLRRDSHAAAVVVEEQSRRALRLMAEELLAAQTQLSQARASYRLVTAELERCRQQPAAAAAPTAAAPTAEAPANAGNAVVVQGQLDVALKKLKAWEDWYASTAVHTTSTATTAAATASVTAPEKAEAQASPNADGAGVIKSGAAVMAPQEAPQPQQPDGDRPHRHDHHHRHHRRSHSRHRDTDGTNAHPSRSHAAATHGATAATTPSLWGCGCAQCGCSAAVSATATGGSGVPGLLPLPAFSSLASAAGGPSLVTASATRPYTSAFAMDTALYELLAQPRGANASGPPPQARDGAPATSTPSPPAPSPKTTEAAQQHAASPIWTVPWGGGGGGGAPRGAEALGRTPNAHGSGSPYCDQLDHAQQQAYRSQVYMTQLAREAAVRELAEAERQVAEQRLTMWEQQHQQQHGHTSGGGAAAAMPSASTPDGAPRAETVE